MFERYRSWAIRGRGSAITALVAMAGVGLAALIHTVASLGVAGETASEAITLYGDAAMGLVAASAVFFAAMRLTDRLSHLTWLSVGASVLLMAVGDALWAYRSGALGVNGVGVDYSDPFYLASYVVFAVGLVRYALGLRDDIDFAWVVTETVVTTAILGATLWVVFLAPTLRGNGGLSRAALADLAYVSLDFVLMVGPVLCVLGVMGRRKDRYLLAPPWFAVAGGVVVTVLADVVWFWERAHQSWAPGSLADFAFMSAGVLFAVGAVAAVDAQSRLRKLRGLKDLV